VFGSKHGKLLAAIAGRNIAGLRIAPPMAPPIAVSTLSPSGCP